MAHVEETVVTFKICRLWRRRPLKWNTTNVQVTGGHFENSSGLVFPPFNSKQRDPKTQTSVTWFPLPKTHVPLCLSAETQSNILWVLISWVFSLMPLFYSMFTLMLGFVRLSTDVLTNRSLLLREKKMGRKKHWEIKHCVGTKVRTSSLEAFSSRSGLETCSSLFPLGLSCFPPRVYHSGEVF